MNTKKPTLINVIAWMTLASGIVNIGFGLVGLSTFVGLICAPISIIPILFGIFEIVYAARLLSNPPQTIKPSTNIAVIEIVCVLFGNVLSMAVGILSLVFYNDTVVKDYFARLNGTLEPVIVTSPAPASAPQPEAVPVIPEPAAPSTDTKE